MRLLVMVGVLTLVLPLAQGSGIRTVRVNDKKMQPISLKMGKASVLRFSEKPKKVVIGNQNYYSVEFIDNDLTIQPLGDVETNLFVYTPYHTYGFILRPCHSCSYDDLVYVKWKSKSAFQRKKKSSKKISYGYKSIGINFDISKEIKVMLVKTMVDTERSLRLIDLQITNKSRQRQNIGSLQLFASRGGKPLKNQGFIIEKEQLKKNDVSKARLFLSMKEKKGFTLNIFLGKKKYKKIVGRKHLK